MKSIAEKGPMLSSPKLSAELSGRLLKFLLREMMIHNIERFICYHNSMKKGSEKAALNNLVGWND